MSAPEPPPLITPLRAVLFIVGCAAVATLVVMGTSEPPAAPSMAGAPGDAAAARPQKTHRPIALKHGGRAPAPRVQVGEEPTEDLWAMEPDEHHLREIEHANFEREGGVASPGTDPEGARREVDADDWPETFAAELRSGLADTVVIGGVEVDRLECQRGRCLIELQFEGMLMALERVGAIRQWLTESVRCRGYTEGPVQEDYPSAPTTQQIWILCGEPDSAR